MQYRSTGASRFHPRVPPGSQVLGVISRGPQIGALVQLPDRSYAQVNGDFMTPLNASKIEATLRASDMPIGRAAGDTPGATTGDIAGDKVRAGLVRGGSTAAPGPVITYRSLLRRAGPLAIPAEPHARAAAIPSAPIEASPPRSPAPVLASVAESRSWGSGRRFPSFPIAAPAPMSAARLAAEAAFAAASEPNEQPGAAVLPEPLSTQEPAETIESASLEEREPEPAVEASISRELVPAENSLEAAPAPEPAPGQEPAQEALQEAMQGPEVAPAREAVAAHPPEPVIEPTPKQAQMLAPSLDAWPQATPPAKSARAPKRGLAPVQVDAQEALPLPEPPFGLTRVADAWPTDAPPAAERKLAVVVRDGAIERDTRSPIVMDEPAPIASAQFGADLNFEFDFDLASDSASDASYEDVLQALQELSDTMASIRAVRDFARTFTLRSNDAD